MIKYIHFISGQISFYGRKWVPEFVIMSCYADDTQFILVYGNNTY